MNVPTLFLAPTVRAPSAFTHPETNYSTHLKSASPSLVQMDVRFVVLSLGSTLCSREEEGAAALQGPKSVPDLGGKKAEGYPTAVQGTSTELVFCRIIS